VAGQSAVAGSLPGRQALLAAQSSAAWTRAYLWRAAVGDLACGVLAGVVAVQARFVSQGYQPVEYVAFTCALPLLWAVSVALAGGYDSRFIGVGPDEFRRILQAAVSLTTAVAIFSYVFKLNIARGYVAVAMPSTAVLDLIMRYWLRKHLHKVRQAGQCLRRVVVVGHAPAVAELTATLSRSSHHGMSVVGACLAGSGRPPVVGSAVGSVPVFGGLSTIPDAVDHFSADTVAVLSCPEMDGTRLRQLGWDLETTGTDLYVAPALLDVAGPRTTIRPVAGLPLLHVDQAELGGVKRIIKGALDRLAAGLALLALAPAFAVIAVAIRLTDHGPVFFKQTRVGKNGGNFQVWKFRTMVVDAEARKARLAELNESAGGMLFKMRRDPRITRVGGWLRRWSLDELPQLINVALGEMSLVGPRPALPAEAEKYGFDMQRRHMVKPGITGLWQVSGRSDLPYDEAVRLDVRYVENWSVALDLQILWKTCSAVFRGSGAY
jgi:exopolysaccharide biosynthesis polyprenyl glycosylphosphotransferase